MLIKNYKLNVNSHIDTELLSKIELTNYTLFNEPFKSYLNYKRRFILAGSFFNSNRSYSVFPSQHSYELNIAKNVTSEEMSRGVGSPIMSVHVPIIGLPSFVGSKFCQFTIHDAKGNEKTFCKVYSKYMGSALLSNGPNSIVRRYVLEFKPDYEDRSKDFRVVMFDKNDSSFADLEYKGNRLRWIGTTPATASVGSQVFNLIMISDENPSLIKHKDQMTPDIRNRLTILGSGQISHFVNYMRGEKYAEPNFSNVPTPVARYDGQIHQPVAQLYKNFANVEVLENLVEGSDPDSINSVNTDSLVVLCTSIVLRLQESQRHPTPPPSNPISIERAQQISPSHR